MNKHDIITVGASAGGVEALTRLCAGLPAGMPAAIFIVQHLSSDAHSLLPKLLNRAGPLPAEAAAEGGTFHPGHIYVAPPDRHLLLRPGRKMLVRRGPHENRTRPSVDALFRSAAVAYGPRVAGLVLTGNLDDGTEGLIAIKQAGGISLVQTPQDATWPSMPQQALLRDHVDRAAPLAELPALLAEVARLPAGPAGELSASILAEDRIAEQEFAEMAPSLTPPGQPSALSCPQCGGVLNEIAEETEGGRAVRFRCQIGHAFTGLGLQVAQNEELERALAIAVRTHRDRLNLFRQLEASARARKLLHAAERWHLAAQEAAQLAEVLETAIARLPGPLEAAEPAD